MSSRAAISPEARRERSNRIVDVAAVGLISLATVLTAWCGYQASRWGTLATRQYQKAGATRLIGSGHAARANTLEAVDVNLFLQYIIAAEENHPAVRDFISRRFRPEMRPAFQAWLATNPLTNPNAPSSPFAMPQYRLAESALADKMQAEAGAMFTSAQQANETGDSYVRLTVIFAAVSFLAGISTRFPYPFHSVVVGLGFVMLIVAIVALLSQPALEFR
jgi:hypothetical protein